MEPFIPDNGTVESEMVSVVKCGLMVLDMKDTGWVIRRMDKVNLCTLTETFTKDNGLMIKHTVKEHILMQMELTITVIGSMTNNTALVWSHGLMVPNMKVTTSMAKKKVKVNSHLPMEATMKENLNKMKYVDMENITGLMVSNMTDSGVIIKCTAKELSSGKIKRNIKDNL